MNNARRLWTVVFLGITGLAIAMECIAGLWHPGGTIPWTEYLAKYVPWPIQLLAYVILAVWLPVHFYHHDRIRGVAEYRGYARGYREGKNVTSSAIARAYARGANDAARSPDAVMKPAIPDADEAARMVFEALGEASVCWITKGSLGEFDSTKAAAVGRRLLTELGYDLPVGYRPQQVVPAVSDAGS